MERNYSKAIEYRIKNSWDKTIFTDYETKHNFCCKDVAIQLKKMHLLFENLGIQKGDKVALLGRNSSNWAIVFLAVSTYGAVIVPILPDFRPEDITNIVKHSESKLVYASKSLLTIIENDKLQNDILGILLVETFELNKSFNSSLTEAYNKSAEEFPIKYTNLSAENFELERIDGKELLEISYTSGTSGNSKGVMLSHHNLFMNAIYCQDINYMLKEDDNTLAFLPLAHSYGCTIDFLLPFILGCHIHFLTKLPTPQILIAALQDIKPRHLLSVPLVIEKIYYKKLQPTLNKPLMKILLSLPGIKKLIYKKIRKTLLSTFGGNLYNVIIGGAPLNDKVERFFKKIDFPFMVGYGMTECGPLVAYCDYKEFKCRSCGRIIRGMEGRIESSNPFKFPGEIQVRGEHVMTGYYKNPEATHAAFTEDGWLKTGDMGIIDKDGFVFIKGRCKSMLLGASGQNIYPEEIEEKFSTYPYVEECLAVQRGAKIILLTYINLEEAQKEGLNPKDLEVIMEENRKDLNNELPTYMGVSQIEIRKEEFQKTPKRSIKRYLYK